MAYIPSSNSVVAFQSDPTKLVGTVSIVGNMNSSVTAFQGSDPWKVNVPTPSLIAVHLAGSVTAVRTDNASVIAVLSNSSVTALQGTNPWVVNVPTSSYISYQAAGSILAVSGSFSASPQSSINALQLAGSVLAVNMPSPSVIAYQLAGSIMAVSATVNTGNSSVQLLGGVAMIGSVISMQGGTWGASVTGTMSVLGTVPVTQATTPWQVNVPTSSYISYQLAGSIMAVSGSFTANPQNSIIALQLAGSVLAVNVGSILTIPGKVSALNSISSQMSASSVFTGTSEEVKDFNAIYVTVFADTASATDGLQMQRSSDGVNWDINDVYTIPASTGKTFQVQPDARFFRLVYTNSATNQGAMRLQTVYKQSYSKPSSQRPSDGYTNETDLEQMQGFNMVYNGTTWDRAKGTAALGAFVNVTGSVAAIVNVPTSSYLSIQPAGSVLNANISGSVATAITNISASILVSQNTNPWVIGSIVGTYQEDQAASTSDKGLFVLHVRNDTMSSVTNADLDYSALSVGPVGEMLVANSPITKWFSQSASVMYGTSVQVVAPPGASIFSYITGIHVMNESANFSRVTLTQGLGAVNASILTRLAAPATGGSNSNYINAIRVLDNNGISASISGVSSVLLTITGFNSKV